MINNKIREYVLLAFVLLCVFGIYLHTMHPAFKNNDSPETAAVAATLGIGHPPGYPLYTIAGKICTLIPVGNYAFRMNTFSALLAVLILLVTYLILTRYIFRLFIPEPSPVFWVLGLGSLFLLAFSFIFWNQALEAKGGIYMLNLLFLAVIIYLSLGLLQVFSLESRAAESGTIEHRPGTRDPRLETKNKLKNIYLISYVFGLSLANHWPSMIILAPVFVFLLIKYRQRLGLKGFILCGLLMAAGLTPYFFLLVRANAGALFNWGNPKDLQGLMWVVLRQGYAVPVAAGMDVIRYQVIEFLRLFGGNYGIFVLLAFAGGYAVYSRARKVFWYLISIFVIVVIMVVFYNRTKQGVIYLIDIFLLPAEYICLLFISAGGVYLAKLFEIKKIALYSAAAAALAAMLLQSAWHYKSNNSDRDFLSYDFGNAVLNTMEKGSVYLADGDYNLMPVYYLQDILKKRQDIILATDSFLIFKWGIDDFIRKRGNVAMKPFDTANNERNIIDAFIGERSVYRSNFFPRFDNYSLPYKQSQYGILTKISQDNVKAWPGIFETYPYRGIFAPFCLLNAANRDLTGWYAVSMVNQANLLNQEGKPAQAIRLYKRALNFPNEKPVANICYNTALAYEKTKDYDNELIFLNRAIKSDPKLTPALERAGLICYERGLFQQAKDLFDGAVLLGSSNEMVIKGQNILNSMTETQRLEAMLIKANEYIEKQDLLKAVKICDFLLEKSYKSDIIYRNLGVYHFRTNNYSAAIENFERSKNETPSVEAYLYTAYAYFKQGMNERAIKELEAGLKLFASDKPMNDLYRQLKEQEKSDEKNTDSNNRQRRGN